MKARKPITTHWPEYLIEAWALGTFMISACLSTALLEHPASPLRQAISSGMARRGIVGTAMGLAAAELYRFSDARRVCAKLIHDTRVHCIFCEEQQHE